MKPNIFIASSKEGKDIAETLQLRLRDYARCTVWDQAFPLSNTTIDTLLKNCAANAFAIFVLSPDDVATMRADQYQIARDTVVFEAGLFMGMHGRDRAFIVIPEGVPSFHLLSDLLGFTTARYDPVWFKEQPNAAVGPTATEVRQAIATSTWSNPRIAVTTKTSDEPGKTFPLKLNLTFTNKYGCGVALEGGTFTCRPDVPLAANAARDSTGRYQIRYFIGWTGDDKEI